MVVGEVRIDREAEQAALAPGAHGHPRDRLRRRRPSELQEPDAARALGDERPAVGQERDLPRDLEAGGHGLHAWR